MSEVLGLQMCEHQGWIRPCLECAPRDQIQGFVHSRREIY